MKNILFIRLGKYLINLPKVTEIYLGEKGEYIEVCYDSDIDNTQIEKDKLETGTLKNFETLIMGLKDENVFFVKFGLSLVNLTRVLGITCCEEEVEICYDDGDITTINNKDIEPDALKKLNEHLLLA